MLEQVGTSASHRPQRAVPRPPAAPAYGPQRAAGGLVPCPDAQSRAQSWTGQSLVSEHPRPPEPPCHGACALSSTHSPRPRVPLSLVVADGARPGPRQGGCGQNFGEESQPAAGRPAPWRPARSHVFTPHTRSRCSHHLPPACTCRHTRVLSPWTAAHARCSPTSPRPRPLPAPGGGQRGPSVCLCLHHRQQDTRGAPWASGSGATAPRPDPAEAVGRGAVCSPPGRARPLCRALVPRVEAVQSQRAAHSPPRSPRIPLSPSIGPNYGAGGCLISFILVMKS